MPNCKMQKNAKPKKFQIYAERNMQNAIAEGEEEGQDKGACILHTAVPENTES